MRGGPKSLAASPRERALAGFASLLTEAPWTVEAADFDRLREVGFGDETLVQIVNIAAYFNYVTRVADATGIEYDYESPLARLEPDRAKAPLDRPSMDAWPRANKAPRLSLALRPATQEALGRWRAYVFGRETPLTKRERTLLAHTAAFHCCDAAGAEEHGSEQPQGERDARLVEFAKKLTLAPWQTTDADLDRLREAGLDDRALLDVIGTVGLQNVLSRTRLALDAA